MRNALKCLRFAHYRRISYDEASDLFAGIQNKSVFEGRLGDELLVQWNDLLMNYGGFEAVNWRRSLVAAKNASLDPKNGSCLKESLVTLYYSHAIMKIDAFPCMVGALLTHPSDDGWVNEYMVIFGTLFSEEKARMTPDILVALAKTHAKDKGLRAQIDALAKEKINSSFDELSKQDVDIEAVIKSLNLDHWPDSVLPREPNGPGEAQEKNP
jgi:hypothetical protein